MEKWDNFNLQIVELNRVNMYIIKSNAGFRYFPHLDLEAKQG